MFNIKKKAAGSSKEYKYRLNNSNFLNYKVFLPRSGTVTDNVHYNDK